MYKMKNENLCILLLLLLSTTFILNCAKEYSCENCVGENKPPIADAGANKLIYFPRDSVVLDGTNSRDPDGTITNWLWSKLSGPASFSISNPIEAITSIKNLDSGIYRFELKVTDNGGLSSRDTVEVKIVGDSTSNRPPVANAGADKQIVLPMTNVTLDGTASTDPDNNIRDYFWRFISGPNSYNIISPGNVITVVTSLQQGTYEFELKVTDSGNLSSIDTTKVTVLPPSNYSCNSNRPIVNAQLTQIGSLSQSRYLIAIASAGDKVFYAGGMTGQYGSWINHSTIDIFNTVTNTWAIASLSEARFSIGAIAAGNKIFFAGGKKYANGNQTAFSSTVDIYDLNTNTWSVSNLSVPRSGVATATVGNKVLFAGGEPANGFSDAIDIYDLSTESWSTAYLSEPRIGISAVTLQNKVYFAGGSSYTTGVSDHIDIYNNSTNSWSVAALQEGRMDLSATTVGNKIFWAGGETWPGLGVFTCGVEIFDVSTGTSTTNYLHNEIWWEYNSGQQAVVNNNKIAFCITPWNSPNFDIYDVNTNTWSIGVLPFVTTGSTIIKANNTIYLAGGSVNGVLTNKVWKLEY